MTEPATKQERSVRKISVLLTMISHTIERDSAFLTGKETTSQDADRYEKVCDSLEEVYLLLKPLKS